MSNDGENIDAVPGKSTRRGLLKVAGAAALGAAGATALRGLPVKASGSGMTIVPYPPLPERVLDTRSGFGALAGGLDYSFGPFAAGGGFDSTVYMGMLGNLTATGWNMAGWLSIRAHGSTLGTISNVNFSSNLSAIPNFVLTTFGPAVAPVPPVVSDGMVTIHCGGPAGLRVYIVLDIFAYLGPDQ